MQSLIKSCHMGAVIISRFPAAGSVRPWGRVYMTPKPGSAAGSVPTMWEMPLWCYLLQSGGPGTDFNDFDSLVGMLDPFSSVLIFLIMPRESQFGTSLS